MEIPWLLFHIFGHYIYLDSINCAALVETLYQLKHLRYLSMERCSLSILPDHRDDEILAVH